MDFIAFGATAMEMPGGKQRQSNADLSEAALWYVRSKAKYLPTDEIRELASWLRRSPENASALLAIATRDHQRISGQSATHRLKQAVACVLRGARAKSQAAEHRALAHRYFDHVKRKYLLPKRGLCVIATVGLAAWMFLDDVRSLQIAAAAFAGFLLLKVKEAVIGFRIVSGYFGTTETEARDLIEFIQASAFD
jgi:ferric-dicitrate binding protein FerR (iron transport regulator)